LAIEIKGNYFNFDLDDKKAGSFAKAKGETNVDESIQSPQICARSVLVYFNIFGLTKSFGQNMK